jgi:hypothetical protein
MLFHRRMPPPSTSEEEELRRQLLSLSPLPYSSSLSMHENKKRNYPWRASLRESCLSTAQISFRRRGALYHRRRGTLYHRRRGTLYQSYSSCMFANLTSLSCSETPTHLSPQRKGKKEEEKGGGEEEENEEEVETLGEKGNGIM